MLILQRVLPLLTYVLVTTATVGCRRDEAHIEKVNEMNATSDKEPAAADDPRRIDQLVEQYVAQHKKWQRSQFRIEHKNVTPDGIAIIWVVYLQDEQNPTPGGGKSVVLHVDRSALRVVKELRFQ